MSTPSDPHEWFGRRIEPGEPVRLLMSLSETFSGEQMRVPVYIWRGEAEGPTVFVTGAVHGDEINGTGAIRQRSTSSRTSDAASLRRRAKQRPSAYAVMSSAHGSE